MDHHHCHHATDNSREVQNTLAYTCPMHPEIMQDKPGMCPECGMSLVSAKNKKQKANNKQLGANKSESSNHDKHAGHSTAMFLKKFWVSFIFSIPVILYSDITFELFRYRAPAFFGSAYLTFVLGSIVFFYGGWVFLIGSYRELKARLPGMMTLIGIAISSAYIYSVFVAISDKGHDLFWELSTLITIMLLGHWIEMRAVSGAQRALKELSKLLPDTAEVVRGSKNETIPIGKLKVGDIVFVRPGSRIPSDGVIVEGKSEVNEAMVTGESAPVAKAENSEVIAGTSNGDGSLKIKVTKVGEQTFLAGVMRLIAEAQASKSRLQILSDRAAFYLTVISVLSGAATFITWFSIKGDLSFAISRLVAVLVISCPHALGLAVPLVAALSTAMAARHGFLVRQRLALEAARNVNVVLFDKTGTLTKGEYGVTNIWTAASDDKVIQLAASVDSHSEHFISKAIVDYAKEKGVAILATKNFIRIPGKGVKGEVDGVVVSVGGKSMLDENKAVVPQNLVQAIEEENKRGKTIIYVLKNGGFLGAVALADIIREESRAAIAELKKLGLRVAMVTGDSENVAVWVAKELGLDEYFARVLPNEKAEKVKLLQVKGSRVAMIGDGINDAPALTQADLGIAIGAGTNVAIESAGIILVRNDPRDIVKIIKLSRRTYTKMIQNLFWAAGYNIVAIPLAAGVLAFKGIFLEPALAAVFMSLSTVIVAVNAVFLRRAEL